MRPHFFRLADTLCNKFAKNNAAVVRGFNQRHYHGIWRPRATTLPSGRSQVSAQENILNIQTRTLSSVSQGDDIEEDVDKKAAWLMKAFLFGTAVYAGCYFVPLMGDSMIQQSVALLRVKDPLFKRMGASRLSRIATNDDRRRTIVEMGGVHGLVNMLNTAPDDLTRREAMKALASLSQSVTILSEEHVSKINMESEHRRGQSQAQRDCNHSEASEEFHWYLYQGCVRDQEFQICGIFLRSSTIPNHCTWAPIQEQLKYHKQKLKVNKM